jgi:FkbM family methyltransferase
MEPEPAPVPALLRAAVRRAHHPEFFFVSIGAHDGVSNDYVFPFLAEYGWRGLAVEPLETSFRELQRNYARFPGVALERAAVSEQPRTLYAIAPVEGFDRPWVSQVSSLDRNLLLGTIDRMRTWQPDGPVPADLESSIVAHDVPCLSFAALMRKHNVEHIDFLSIDAEGCDYEIFRCVDLRRYRPQIIMLETAYMPASQQTDLDHRLNAAGYRFLTRPDFLTAVFASDSLLRRMRVRERLWATFTRLRERRRRS